MIQFENVSKQFQDGTQAVKSINFTINAGEIFVLIGPSGSGKTTTLKMINRLIEKSSGAILINGKDISDYDIHELRWNMGYVLQQIALFPHMTIEENIAVVPELKNWRKERIRDRVDELLEMVRLDPKTYKHRKPAELSGGQQQRIGVARALAADPEIILMDEPFSALDPISREKLQDDILKLQKNISKTIVFVTHDMQEAMKLGDRVCLMKEGEIVQIGTPSEILANPASDFVQEFVGNRSLNIRLADFVVPTENGEFPANVKPVSIFAPLHEVLENLSEAGQIPVEKNGEVIGSIHRGDFLRHMAQSLKEGGQVRG
ncbi:glycine/betaine ABC transporter ATP-binding protein [Weizmannia acidilactici]|uniref:ABC transporter ATP-binding protein n=1 Tax=Weizmannia acidilactici TaxID=2607726 RepID=UPI00124E63C1|nr:ABC transporter ATP-binding protein [Weizmannia acidilactici]GER68299.1 glycine/betaine ABC transporter ATP-binding protein [Weizmannia acidilactici]